ncbi:hypothetical protein I350_00821 [Cryptococcus amylolentus CBS 6273]|uniref:Potassium transport protein n=1 Tax=Cryptococcus amylolentus CBS 6273 TaxID=1296118 RepID=A0A1E3KHG6_9TREE|nr:hypothetical protein I350_00821 [Cryptococcus amylolentus CBS 6273]
MSPFRKPSLSTLPSHLELPTTWTKFQTILMGSMNFYRIHLIAFTVIPLITSGIMYACNTEIHISYIDCLFCCMSAMTVTGLASVNLSTLSVVQQVILFVQMIIGSLTFVSIVMIMVRQYFIRQSFKHVLQERQNLRNRLSKTLTRVATVAPPLSALRKKFSRKDKDGADSPKGSPKRSSTPSSFELNPVAPSPRKPEEHKPKKKRHEKLRPDMIKRVEGGGVGLVNNMGWYDAQREKLATPAPTPERRGSPGSPLPTGSTMLSDSGKELTQALEAAVESGAVPGHQVEDNGEAVLTESPTGMEDYQRHDGERRERLRSILEAPDINVQTVSTDTTEHYSGEEDQSPSPPHSPDAFPRSKTIAFEDTMDDSHDFRERATSTQRESFFPRSATFRSNQGQSTNQDRLPYSATMQSGAGNFPRTYSLRPTNSNRRQDHRLQGFGGFPTPLDIGKKVFRRVFPETHKNLSKSFTMPRTNTYSGKSTMITTGPSEGKEVPYISFAATVGRNSRFQGLTKEQMDELGGVEYRALRVLLHIVVGYFIFVQIAAFIIMAPYIAAGGRYQHVFDDQPRQVKVYWFALFQSVSAFTNTGMSLCDLSMVPFQRAYLMIVVLIILIFAGNTAFVIFVVQCEWTLYKLVPVTSRIHESLKFLLDHPRRCFVYLFPATQTWVLALVMLGLTLIDWVSFLVLDLGTEAIMSLPVGTRIAAGFLQSAAVRASGFSIVSLGALAPAVKVLYVVMMYISVYPIALSVRATNVYEEKSLGLFDEEVEDDDVSEEGEGAQAVAKYIGWHARRQLAFDIWWLGFALWLVCIIERGHIDNDQEWFNIFNIIFELVSAYGTVGLTVGLPYDNFSFSGSFRKLSKLVIIAVMLRGRHRGLPVAIDRAVMLPKDFTAEEEAAFEEERSRRMSRSRRGSSFYQEEPFVPRSRPESFGGTGAYQEVNFTPGPVTAIPIPHHHQHHVIHSEQKAEQIGSGPGGVHKFGHFRSSSTGSNSHGPESPTFQPRESEDRWPHSGNRALTPVREGHMSSAQSYPPVYTTDSALEV